MMVVNRVDFTLICLGCRARDLRGAAAGAGESPHVRRLHFQPDSLRSVSAALCSFLHSREAQCLALTLSCLRDVPRESTQTTPTPAPTH